MKILAIIVLMAISVTVLFFYTSSAEATKVEEIPAECKGPIKLDDFLEKKCYLYLKPVKQI